MSTPEPLFGCSGCYMDRSLPASDLRIGEDGIYCVDCWIEMYMVEHPMGWNDLPKFVPDASERIEEQERAASEIVLLEHTLDAATNHVAELQESLARKQQLLQALHRWFLKSAPGHYKGCCLYMDLADELRPEEQETEK